MIDEFQICQVSFKVKSQTRFENIYYFSLFLSPFLNLKMNKSKKQIYFLDDGGDEENEYDDVDDEKFY